MMVKDEKLTDHEKGQIKAFSKTSISSHTIEIKIRRSKNNKLLKIERKL